MSSSDIADTLQYFALLSSARQVDNRKLAPPASCRYTQTIHISVTSLGSLRMVLPLFPPVAICSVLGFYSITSLKSNWCAAVNRQNKQKKKSRMYKHNCTSVPCILSGMHRLLVIKSYGSVFSNFEAASKVKANLVSPLQYVFWKAS